MKMIKINVNIPQCWNYSLLLPHIWILFEKLKKKSIVAILSFISRPVTNVFVLSISALKRDLLQLKCE